MATRMMLSGALIRYVSPLFLIFFSSTILKIPSLAEWGMGLAPSPKAFDPSKINGKSLFDVRL